MRVKSGWITTTLLIPAAGLTLAALVFPLLQTPAPPGYSSKTTAVTAFTRPVSSDQALFADQALYRKHGRKAKLLTVRRKAVVQAVQAPAPPPPVAPAAYAPSAGQLTSSQVGAYWLEAGGPASQEAVAECVAYHESTDHPGENNYEDNYGTQTSWGLFQVSNGTHQEYVADIDSPLVNTRIAVAKYDASGWSPWTTAGDCGA